MTLTPELLVALAGLFTAMTALVTQWRTTQSAVEREKTVVKRQEVELLREEVARLQARVATLETDYHRERRRVAVLLDYIALLRALMVEAGISVPQMPVLE